MLLNIEIDSLPEVQELIKQGAMTGNVLQDSRAHANAICTTGMNLFSGTYLPNGKNYKLNKTELAIKLPSLCSKSIGFDGKFQCTTFLQFK